MKLADAQIAVLAENMYQELELWYPLMRLREEGCNVVVVGPAEQTYASKLGYPVKPDLAIADADPAAFDAVVIPGGFAPENMRRHVSDIFSDIGKDAEYRRQMTEQGLEIVDFGYDKIPAFMEERKKAYLSSARLLGLIK